jgi:AraC-like DNA-binding protein
MNISINQNALQKYILSPLLSTSNFSANNGILSYLYKFNTKPDKRMDILFQQLSKESEYCINLLEVELPHFIVPWHYHPETEIIYIEKSTGSRFVGDHSEPFDEGDIGLIGSNLPHVWKNDIKFHKNISGLCARALVVHFREAIFKGPLAELPEMQGITQLLFDSQYGIKFTGSARANLEIQMKQIVKSSGIDKMQKLIYMLDFMSSTDEKQILASTGYSKIRKSDDFDRFDKAHRYMIDNFQNNITLTLVSDLVGMTPTSFCRYFKKRTTKSFQTFLNEIRVGHACKLLLENRMNISGICFESGFNNVSNFNEQFKKIKGISPSRYIRNRAATT